MTDRNHGQVSHPSGRSADERPSLADRVRRRLLHNWLQVMGRQAPRSPFWIGMASGPLGPNKDRRRRLAYLGPHLCISPRAQIKCTRLRCGPQCFTDDGVTIYAYPGAEGEVCLEAKVHLSRGTMVELGSGHGSVHMGANTYVQASCVFSVFVGSIRLGTSCLVAARCAFTPYQHGFADTDRPIREQPLSSRGDIVVEDDVWLALNACVMNGVTIGGGGCGCGRSGHV